MKQKALTCGGMLDSGTYADIDAGGVIICAGNNGGIKGVNAFKNNDLALVQTQRLIPRMTDVGDKIVAGDANGFAVQNIADMGGQQIAVHPLGGL